MSEIKKTYEKQMQYEEIDPKALNGMAILLIDIILSIAAFVGFISSLSIGGTAGGILAGISIIYLLVVAPFLFLGLKVLKPNEAFVFTLFGKYIGTLKGEGFFFMNPLAIAVEPAPPVASTVAGEQGSNSRRNAAQAATARGKKISLKTMTLNNETQKINDVLGNPIIIGIVVIWRVVNTAKAVFNVDNYSEFLAIQCDSSLRNIVRLYPYDTASDDHERSLRGSSQEVAEMLKAEIQEKAEIAGLEIMEARITHLSYAPEIAAAMLQRQQASAIIDARTMIVEGAVSMVEMALVKLNESGVVNLDEERKAAMVSNLLVVLCGNRDVQPVVNSGTIY